MFGAIITRLGFEPAIPPRKGWRRSGKCTRIQFDRNGFHVELFLAGSDISFGYERYPGLDSELLLRVYRQAPDEEPIHTEED